MATSVTVLCTNGRRVAIKVTPSTALLQVLEDACRRQKLDPSKHTLKHGQKTLDLSALFRYTNIPKNAHLEMVPSDRSKASGEVVLAVQCADGSRHQAKFNNPTTSLWDVLVKVGVVTEASGEPVVVYMNSQVCGEDALKGRSLKDLGLTSGRAAIRFLYRQNSTENTQSQPVQTEESIKPPQPAQSDDSPEASQSTHTEVPPKQPQPTDSDISEQTHTEVISVAEHTTEEAKQSTDVDTASQEDEMEVDDEQPKSKPEPQTEHPVASHDSETVHQLPYRNPSISFFDELSEATPPSTTAPPDMPVPSPALQPTAQVLPVIHHMELVEDLVRKGLPRPPPARPVARVYAEPCDRERVVYHLDDPLPVTHTDVSDDFFKVTHRDVQLMQEDLRKQVAMEDAPLLTSAMRQVLKEKRFEGYSHTVLRVHLPDRWVLQGVFRPQESLKALVRYIRDNLADPGLKFHLYTTPPKTVLKSGRPTFQEAGFVPAAIVHLGVEGEQATPLLSKECLDSAQSALEAEVVVVGKRGSTTKPLSISSPVPSHPTSKNEEQRPRKSAESAAMGKAVPKWFKLGK